MRPIFLDELARERAAELRRRIAGVRRTPLPRPRPGLREAVGLRLVRAGYRMIGGRT